MRSKDISTGYGPFAWFYDMYWGKEYHSFAGAIVERLLFSEIPAGSRILDIGCGTGHMARALIAHGYPVTGIDISEEMLSYARKKAAAAEFILADARVFRASRLFQAAVSTFESLNHILTPAGLRAVFRNIHTALARDGVLVFDMLMEEAYRSSWHKTAAIVEEDHVCIIRGSYDPVKRIGKTNITMFRPGHRGWVRSEANLIQRCYPLGLIVRALEQAGFSDTVRFSAAADLGMPGDLGLGRVFFKARK